MDAKYDIIGINYSELRKPDSRIASMIVTALGSAQTILNVGAGTGSYEPVGRRVIAIDPSAEMIGQRSPMAPKAIQACADNLPFAEKSFDASMAILTVHHWPDKQRGLKEMRRVTRGQMIILTFDPSFRGAWLTDYFPELLALDEAQMPSIQDYENWLGAIKIMPVPIPSDCSDGFLYAYWRRPGAYLDARIRAGISSFWAIKKTEEGLDQLSKDLKTGEWERRYSSFLTRDTYDLGYRLIIAN